MEQPVEKTLTISHKCKHMLTVWPRNPTPSSNKLEIHVHTKTHTWMCIVLLFIFALNWKQPKSLTASRWMNKFWYILTLDYYLSIKRSKYQNIQLGWIKEESLKKLHGSYNILKCKASVMETNQWVLGFRSQGKMGGQREWGFWGWWNCSVSWFWCWLHKSVYVL